MVLGRRDEIITTGLTTIVVMVVAIISPVEAWRQPVLCLADTVVGMVFVRILVSAFKTRSSVVTR